MPPGAAALITLSQGSHRFEQGGNILGRANVYEGHSQELVPGIAVLAHSSCVYRKKAQCFPVKDPSWLWIVVKQFAVVLFAFLEQLFRSATFGDVAGNLGESTQVASPVRQGTNNYIGQES